MSAPYVRVPNELPDLRLWLRQEWQRGPFVQATLLREKDPIKAELVIAWELRQLLVGTLWWVNEDMVDLLLAAVPDVPDAVQFEELPIPSSSGLVVFGRSWKGTDTFRPEEEVSVDALVWGPVKIRDIPGHEGALVDCLGLSSYRRLIFEDGLSPLELRMATERGAFEHAQRKPIGHFGEGNVEVSDQEILGRMEDRDLVSLKKKPKAGERAFALYGASWLPLGRSDWPMTDPLGETSWAQSEHERQSFLEDRRIVAALWTLVAQEGIADRRLLVPERQIRRRQARAGITRADAGHVQVVTLRRTHQRSSHANEDGGRSYSHRWLVTGHWRHQACGPNHSQRKLTWIRPHVKGPDDAPLIAKERVNAWIK